MLKPPGAMLEKKRLPSRNDPVSLGIAGTTSNLDAIGSPVIVIGYAITGLVAYCWHSKFCIDGIDGWQPVLIMIVIQW
jgi:hypothetical protein